jgi:peroxiredoxin
MRRRETFITLLLFFLLIVSILWGYKNHLKIKDLLKTNQELIKVIREQSFQKNSQGVEQGDSVSDFVIRTINNQNIYISKNQEVLLIFIDTSCQACIDSLIEIWNRVKKYQKFGLKIFAIGLSSEESLKEVQGKFQLPIPFAQDAFAQLHRRFGIKGAPSLVYIKNGLLRLSADPLSLDDKLTELTRLLEKSERK